MGKKYSYGTTKGNTLIKMIIDNNPDKEYVGVCEPCQMASFNREHECCANCGYYLFWVRSETFKGQGVRMDYVRSLSE